MLLLLKKLLIDSIDRCPRKSAIENCAVQTIEKSQNRSEWINKQLAKVASDVSAVFP